MKATGILRRVDDLGRIVIPKEIRRTLRIHEGDALEIYIDDDMVCFKRYCPQGEWQEDLKKIEEEVREHYWMPNSEYSELAGKLSKHFQEIEDIINTFEKRREED
jgi:AbrB family looped-hinge helix DNA binding protein